MAEDAAAVAAAAARRALQIPITQCLYVHARAPAINSLTRPYLSGFGQLKLALSGLLR